ncbi:HWE histidine kinase domain-containing protein [Phenylobacterium sp.]|uniref:HWE histidine kinase domain-containing protein n=1 Tax=Phenylobacterium sp. TaxID=1871053 RepID=UPI002DE299E6|nr:HWE histidine kinase domain-containing protein [Phenylobacterium sp.]
MPTIRTRNLVPGSRDAPGFAALYVAYALAAWLGLHWAIAPGGGTPIWPGAGIAFVGLLLGGPQLWPAILLARITVALVTHSPQPWWADLGVAGAATLSALTPVLIIRRLGGLDSRLGSLTDMARLILLGGVLGAAISALGALSLLTTSMPVARFATALENWVLGYFVGVMLVAPILLMLSRREAWRPTPMSAVHLAACMGAVAVVAAHIFLQPSQQPIGSWLLFPFLVWAALAFSVPGASFGLVIVALIGTWAAIRGVWPQPGVVADAAHRVLMAQEFLAASGLTVLVLAAVSDERRAKEQVARSERRLRAETEALETLNATGELIAADLDLESVVQKVTDAGTTLTAAQFGAFFYNVIGDRGEEYMLFTLSGAPRDAFERFGMPRNTKVFAPTFDGEGVVRSDDIQKDPRYGQNPPHNGQPTGHLPVRSYLAAPVKSRSGEVLGGLFFGHPEVGVFDERAERLAAGLAGQAAIAIDNARLYQAAQREIAERTRAEEHQRLLINELNHRVKNTLATVQSIAAQARRAGDDPLSSYETFSDRLMALSRAHDVLTAQRWEGVDLVDIVAGAVRPFGADAGRFKISGPSVWMEPQAALALAMALHELATNAAKYGALSVTTGEVSLTWTVKPDGEDGLALDLTWRESKGPKVAPPSRKGFGSRLLERGLAAELNGVVTVDYRPDGLVCEMRARLPAVDGAAVAAAE